MTLDWIIAQLRARAPIFEGRVVGAAEFKILPEATTLKMPAAFVIPLDDSPEASMAMNSIMQKLNDSFAVIVAVSNVADEKGHASASAFHTMRAALWAALLGWRPVPPLTDQSESRYDGIAYEGGMLLNLDRARAWFQFEFGAPMEIGPADGFQETALGELPPFLHATVDIDALDPERDTNVAGTGPDGRIEHVLQIPKSGDLPQ